MQFDFFPEHHAESDYQNRIDESYSEKSWRFTDLGGSFQEKVASPPTNSFSLVEMKSGSWAQIVALPRHSEFPIVGVAVGTYVLILGQTERGAVRVQVIGKQVTLAGAIAQQIYVRPFYFTN